MEMNIQKYKAFIKTVEYGSFSQAAIRLSYSQSGISRMIADLEKEWGVTLLERGRGGIRLTSDGTKLLPFMKKVCEEFDSLQQQVDELNGLQSGLIRIGTFSSVATHWLPPVLKRFQHDYPNIDFELLMGDYSEIEEWILDGRVDFGFLPLPVSDKLTTIVMDEDPLLAVIPKDNPYADQITFPVEALCDYPFILLEKGEKGDVTYIFEENRINPQIRFTTLDDYAIMSMVENGLGISILPGLILKRNPYDIAVKELSKPAKRTIVLAMRDPNAASLAVRKFIEYLKDNN